MSIEAGCLYVVATPIGNLQDLSPRAISVLGEVDVVLAEDTRVSLRLLRHFGIQTPLQSCHAHNERSRCAQVVERLRRGGAVALISDAGTPLVSDPGVSLVRAVHQAGLQVRAIPGPSAVMAALSAAGLEAGRFVFEGFLPPRPAARMQRLEVLEAEERTLVFLEAPHRVLETLADLAAAFGAGRRGAVARELTKVHETVYTATLAELRQWLVDDPQRQRGEFVLLVAGAEPRPADERRAAEVMGVLMEYLPARHAAAAAARITGVSKNALYRLTLAGKGE